MGDTELPALLRAKVNVEDKVAVTKVKGLQTGFMILSEFEAGITSKVFISESAAKGYADGEEIIKVDIIRKF